MAGALLVAAVHASPAAASGAASARADSLLLTGRYSEARVEFQVAYAALSQSFVGLLSPLPRAAVHQCRKGF